MADKVQIIDRYGILREFNPDATKIVSSNPDIEAGLASIDGRVEQATYLEPYFFHPDQAVQARAANACVFVDVGKLGDYLVNVLASATDVAALSAAAKAVWKRDESGTGSIDYIVDSLQSYKTSIGQAAVSKVMDVLLAHAADDYSRTKLSSLMSSM